MQIKPLTLLPATCLALLVAGCGTPYPPYEYRAAPHGGAPVAAQHDAMQAARGNPQARLIVREGPVAQRDGMRSPEEAARDEAGKYCASVNMEPRVLNVQRQRWPQPGGDYERVQLSFACMRGQP